VLGVVSSDGFIAAVVLGVPIVVAVVVVLASGRRLRGPALAAVGVVAVVVIALIGFGVYRSTPETSAAAGAGTGGSQGPVLPPVVSPTGAPPSAPTTPSAPPTTPTSTAPAAPCSPSGTKLQETAANVAFSQDCLAAAGGQAFTITFDNKDAGIPHNIHIFEKDPAQDPNAKSLFFGQLVTGPTTTTYQVPALLAGTYYFHCDVHPTTMTGTFVVK
jgi:plastocyanin